MIALYFVRDKVESQMDVRCIFCHLSKIKSLGSYVMVEVSYMEKVVYTPKKREREKEVSYGSIDGRACVMSVQANQRAR